MIPPVRPHTPAFTPSALAPGVFVKTPGYSPLKTRLAQGIGTEAAERFHGLSAQAVFEVLAGAATGGPVPVTPLWLVAEPEALGRWGGMPAVAQAAGDLGRRLAAAYEALGRHGAIPVLLGADAPQLTADHLRQVAGSMGAGADYVVGPATDGGFWLLAGRLPIPSDVWAGVPYSCERTCEELCRRLAPLGRVSLLAPMTDVDTKADLPALTAALAALTDPTPAQAALLAWLRALSA